MNPNRRRRYRRNTDISSFIRVGDRVTIVDRFGQRSTGRAVMRGPHGWVLNMGGRYGTPAVAADENIVAVKPSRPRSYRRNKASKLPLVLGVLVGSAVVWIGYQAYTAYVRGEAMKKATAAALAAGQPVPVW
jgi:hypothetical protein